MATNGKKLPTQQSVNQTVKAICDIMRRSNCAGALQYVPELTWILFLRILDEREEIETDEARAVGAEYRPSLTAPYRWRDWAAPDGAKRAMDKLLDAKILEDMGERAWRRVFVAPEIMRAIETPLEEM